MGESRSKQAMKAKRKAYWLGELKCTVVVVGSFLMLMFGYLICCHAEELATPSTPSTYEEIMNEIEMNEYTEVFENMTAEDWDYLAKCVYCEAGLSNIECAEGTACVILNRVLSPDWPNTVTEVVNQPGQFVTRRFFKRAVPNALTYAAIANVQNHGARVIRNALANLGWDLDTQGYVFFATKKQSYAKDHILIGIDKPGQKHWLGRMK